MLLSHCHIQLFQKFILNFHHHHGRHDLPWRLTSDPYQILVSELMLQQTQVERVIPKYLNFLQRFPSVVELNAATLADVLKQWQGLGYNRRAKFLHQTAQKVTQYFQGSFPTTEEKLKELPGIGPYTASAVYTFAYNQPTLVIETNIRSVFIHHFFPNRSDVKDSELIPLIQATIETTQPKNWYSALMDYGSHLKKALPNPNRKSKHHTKQSTFKGSKREVRGSIIRELTMRESLTAQQLKSSISGERKYFTSVLDDLVKEKLVMINRNIYSLYEEGKV